MTVLIQILKKVIHANADHVSIIIPSRVKSVETLKLKFVAFMPEQRMCCSFYLYLPMGKSHLTQYLSKVPDCVSPMAR